MKVVAALALAVAAALAAGAVAGEVPGEAPQPPAEPYARTPAELVPYRDFGAPYRRLFTEPLAFLGPTREEPAPADATEVRVGLLVPSEDSPDWLEGRGLVRGAELAVAEANARGGIAGLPVRLITRLDLPIWGASSNEVVAMAYEDRVWAIVGSVSGDSSHIAIRVALKAQLAVMNTATSDPTLTETGIPWAFRCVADDRQQSYALARHIFLQRGLGRIAVLRANDRYGRFGIAELRDAARRLGRPLVAEVQWLSGVDDFDPLAARLEAARPDGVVLWGGPSEAGRALRRMRERGLDVPAFGPARLLHPSFLAAAGEAAEGLVAAATFDPTSEEPEWLELRRLFAERYGEEPDGAAAHAYDGMNLVLQAIREAGLNRALIRDRLAAVGEYRGASGRIVFDNTFNDVGEIFLATVEAGAFRYRPAAAAPPPAAGAVTIGLLRAAEGEPGAIGEELERGVRLALEEAGGPALVTVVGVPGAWSGVGEAARDLIRQRGATGLISALDGAGSHVVAQIATRLRTPVAVATGPPPLLRHTGVPWLLFPEAEGDGEPDPGDFRDRFIARFAAPPGDGAQSGYRAARRLLAHLHATNER